MHSTAIPFELGDEIVLLSEASRDLFLLNPTAGVVWRGLTAGLSVDEVADALSQVLARPRDAVAEDCHQLLREWERLGLTRPSALNAPGEPEASEAVGTPKIQAPPARPTDRAQPLQTGVYRMVDFAFLLRTETGPNEQAVHEYLAHLRVADESADRLPILDLYTRPLGYRLECDGSLVDHCTDPEGLIPMVHGNLIMAAYRRSDCIVALHAAAVSRKDTCVLLVGVAGSGKSTLTSALLQAGFRYLADDTVLLSRPPVRVRGVTSRVCLKAGSWPIVAKRSPQVMTLPEHRRRDGKRVRYWLPEHLCVDDIVLDALPARALVFVRYSPTAEPSLRTIGPGQALVQLAKSGYDVSEVLDRQLVGALVEWIAGIDCFELNYNDENCAVERVAALLS
jgi:hypothetical protein